jgi:hypothetical protein
MGIITNGLLGYWHYAQGVSGSTWQNIAPSTAGSYNGTLTNGVTLQVDGMYFDGVDDKVVIPSPSLDFDANAFTTNSGYTIEFAIKRVSNGTDDGIIFASDNSHAGIRIDTNGKIVIKTTNSSTMATTATVSENVEHIIQIVYSYANDNRISDIYVDGVKVASNLFSSNINWDNSLNMTFGSAWNSVRYKGNIKFIRFYTRNLTSAEVTQNYNNGTAIGLVSGNAYTANLSDTFTLSETFNKLYTPGASGTAYTKSLSDSFALSETFTKVTSRYKTVAESITLSETVTKRYSGFKTINDAITSAETFTKQFAGYKSLSDSVPFSDNLSRQYSAIRNINDSISASDSISKSFTATIIDSIATGDAENEQSSKLLNDILSSADSVSSTKGKAVNLSDSIAITETIRKALAKIQSDSISSADVDSESINRRLNDAIASTDSITTFKGKTVTLSDSITLTDALNKAISNLKIDSVGLSENFGKTSAVSVRVYDVIISTDHLDTFLPNVPTYNEVINLTLEIAQGKTVNLAIVERGNYELDVVERKTIDIKL